MINSSLILILNAGSSSLKVSLANDKSSRSGVESEVEPADIVWSKSHEIILADASEAEIEALVKPHSPAEQESAGFGQRQKDGTIVAVGHRVVHGGDAFSAPAIMTDEVLTRVESLCELAPLHNPPALKVMRVARRVFSSCEHFAVFDTAFHTSMPAKCKVYPVPYEWYENEKIMRYGFHGISHKYCCEKAATLYGQTAAKLRTVTCHLGNGCSLSACIDGVSCDTTMGFTPLEGLMMGTRSGSIDPGLLLHLERRGYTVENIDNALNHRSGLLGVSGVSKDMRQVIKAMEQGHERAKLAFDIFIQRLISAIGAMAASIGGIDLLAFTGGIGENSTLVRQECCKQLGFLGIVLDEEKNNQTLSDRLISASESPVKVAVVAAREDLAILKEWIHLKRKRG